MTTVEKYGFTLTLDGHAGENVVGKDIVCAAASILTFTLAKAVEDLRAKGIVSECALELASPGHAVISCRPQEGYSSVVSLAYRTICGGFEILAANHPEHIVYRDRETRND